MQAKSFAKLHLNADLSVMRALARRLDSCVRGICSAARVMLAPAILRTRVIGLSNLRVLVESNNKLTLTSINGSALKIVSAKLGTREDSIPCRIDPYRMPPLRPFIEQNIIEVHDGLFKVKDLPKYNLVIELSQYARNIVKIINTIYRHKIRFITLKTLKALTRISEDTLLLEYILVLRMLYPAVLEIILPSGLTVDSLLREFKLSGVTKVKLSDVIDYILKKHSDLSLCIVEENTGVPSSTGDLSSCTLQLHYERISNVFCSRECVVKGIVSPVTLYKVPKLLAKVNFNDRIVLDLGAGFGTKGAYAIKKGAKLVIFLDIDPRMLKFRASGTHTERIQADARMLPLRNKCIDITIGWNVLQFIGNHWFALREIKRVTREFVLVSVYNARSALHRYSFRRFLREAMFLGLIFKVVRGKSQYQALVRIPEKCS